MQLSVLVILYNSSISQSTTLQSILQADVDGSDVVLHIWNNGPHLLDKSDIDSYKEQAALKGINVAIYQDIRNIALSKVYNFVLNQQDFDFFIPLDQDTQLNSDYFTTIIKHQHLDLVLPIVYAEGQQNLVKFPFNVRTKQPVSEPQEIEAMAITSVTSGLALSKRLVMLFAKHEITVFDESFAFYGIDTAFFLNIHKIAQQDEVKCGCFGQIEHSLSTYVKESKQASYRRSMEFLYYALIYRLNYKEKSRLSMCFFVLSRLLKGRIKDIKGLKNTFYCIRYKRHPRAALDIQVKS